MFPVTDPNVAQKCLKNVTGVTFAAKFAAHPRLGLLRCLTGGPFSQSLAPISSETALYPASFVALFSEQ
jgi:hypothetical protein